MTENVSKDTLAELWQESDLDQYQLPHPLPGKLTVREMLYFAIITTCGTPARREIKP